MEAVGSAWTRPVRHLAVPVGIAEDQACAGGIASRGRYDEWLASDWRTERPGISMTATFPLPGLAFQGRTGIFLLGHVEWTMEWSPETASDSLSDPLASRFVDGNKA
jgi:hypothetical protein